MSEHDLEHQDQQLDETGETGFEIAVIGMTGRFPGAKNLDEFWENLKGGVESISFFSNEELAEYGVDGELLKNPNYVKAKGVLEDMEVFDARFFGYSPGEATTMDPQIRILHEQTYHVLEDAGLDPESYDGSIGLYVGASADANWMSQYLLSRERDNLELFETSMFSNKDMISTLISYRLNLKGPSYTLTTACSTSLAAIHLGCRGLLTGECSVALAGGVTVMLPKKFGYLVKEGMIYAPDGHCRPFDAAAGGTIFSDGVGMVALKRLEDALEEGDRIHAVIKASAANNDGRRKVGYVAPSVEGQVDVIQTALELAEVAPETITYVEAHGTGTLVGDPIEVEALTKAFDAGKKGYCALGAVKASIGHLNAAAGVAGFIKTLLAMKHRMLPPAVNYTAPNPAIDFESSPFYVNTGLKEWRASPGDGPLRAGVSSFGVGGTNVHVILEEAPAVEPPRHHGRSHRLFLLSAKSDTSLDLAAQQMAAYIENHPDLDLDAAAYTLQTGRNHFLYRQMAVAAEPGELVQKLRAAEHVQRVETENNPIVFMFSGQGSQYVNMGRDLYETEPLFRGELDGCFDILKSLLGYDLKPALYPPSNQEGEEPGAAVPGIPDINQTAVTQPVIFSFQYALARLLMSWGIRPHAMIGHSIGEYTAACLAGVFSLKDALKVVAERGRLMQALPAGSMLSVPYSCEEVRLMLDRHPELSLAADNSASLCVVAGPGDAVETFAAQLEKQDKAVTRLRTSHAFHSAMMDPMLAPFEEVLKTVTLHPPQMPYVSNAGGEWITREQACDPGYWVRHVRNTVRFSPGLTRLLEDPKALLVEVGPGRTLSAFVNMHPVKKPDTLVLNLIRHPKDAIDDNLFLWDKIGRLWLQGNSPDWAALYEGLSRRIVTLPGYAFEPTPYLSKAFYSLPSVGGAVAEGVPASTSVPADLRTAPLLFKRPELRTKFAGPRDPVEEAIAAVWCSVFGLQKVGIHDNFFELGGDSLIALRVISQVNNALKVEVPVSEIFIHNTIAELGTLIEKHAGAEPEVKYQEKQPDPGNMYHPFSLTEIQLSYLLGRHEAFEMGGVSTHAYQEIKTTLDIPRMTEAINHVIRRHPMLRAVIIDGSRQVILKEIPTYTITVEDISHLGEQARRQRLSSERERMAHYIFQSDKWPLFDIKAFKLDPENHYLCIGMDMLISDAASIALIARDLLAFYEDGPQALPPLDFTFRDYMLAYEELKESPLYARDRDYWLARLEEFPPAPSLPMKANPADIEEPHFNRCHKTFTVEEWDRLKASARENNITPSALLASVYADVLAYWSNQPRLAFNLTVFNRFPFHPDVTQIVGDFTSIILLGLELEPGAPFWEKAAGVQRVLFEALEHRHYDGVDFIRELSRHHGMTKQAVMPIIFTSVLFSNDGAGMEAINRLGERQMGLSQTSQVFVDYQAGEEEGQLVINWDYVEDLFEEDVINAIFHDYVSILDHLLRDGGGYDLQPPEKTRAMLEIYNKTEEPIEPVLLHRLFEEQARRTPGLPAVLFGDDALTYREVDERSNRIARYLRDRGVQPNETVSVITHRCIETIVNVMGVIKSGGAYVPIDPDYPEDRQEYIAQNSNSRMTITPGLYREKELDVLMGEPLEPVNRLDELAYIIYTSGSTGRPKGVMETHRQVSNTIIDIDQKFNVTEKDRILAISSMCFDLSVYDVFGALGAGAGLVIITSQKDIPYMIETMDRHKVTFWNSVPAIMDMTIEYLEPGYTNPHLREVLLSGDWIPPALPGKIKRHFPNASVTSLGGATEGSIWSIFYPITEVPEHWKSIPYGHPLANQQFYVLDFQQRYCPVDVPGELYIGGTGVAEGYMADEEKTHYHFVQHPALGRLYRTGDFGVFRKEGYIEFLGRRDSQVKIRGFRIELGEIETRMAELPAIKDGVVIVKEQKGNKVLCAFAVPVEPVAEEDWSAWVEDFKKQLVERLPEYMVPATFIQLPHLPISPTGKIDRKKLSQMDVAITRETVYEAPHNDMETGLVSIFEQALGVEGIGINDSFFALGGDSLKAISVVAEARKRLQVEIPLMEIFADPTVKELSQRLQAAAGEAAEGGEALVRAGEYPQKTADWDNLHMPFGLTAIQKAYVLGRSSQFEMGGVSTHMYLEIESRADIGRFERALNRVIKRHPMMRMVVVDNYMQKILEETPEYHILVEDVRTLDPQEQEARIRAEQDRMSHHMFDPGQWPMFEIKAFHTSEEVHYVLIGFDLIIGDAASVQIISKELAEFYLEPERPEQELQFSFRDYFLAMEELRGTPVYARDRDYWLARLETFPAAPVLPFKCNPSEVETPRFERHHYTMKAEQWQALKKIARQKVVTPSVVLCTAYADVLAYWSNQEKLALNLPIFNRLPFHPDVGRVVGDFTSVCLLGIDLSAGGEGHKGFYIRARAVQDALMEALEHRHYDGVEFIRDLSRHQGAGTRALMPVIYTSILFDSDQGFSAFNEIGEFKMSLSQTSQVYVDNQVMEADGNLNINWDYVADLFAPRVIETMFNQYIMTLEKLAAEAEDFCLEPPPENMAMLLRYNRTEEDIPPPLLHDLFIRQARRTPGNIALEFEEETMTYRELDEKSNRVARYLKEKGAQRGSLIGVLSHRCTETIVNVMGVLKAGAAYVPIDPDYPKDRQEYIYQNSGCKEMIEQDFYEAGALGRYSSAPPDLVNVTTDLAYVIYTSGSTGRPKGVMETHGEAGNTIIDINRKFKVSETDKILGVSSMCFDLSVYDVFGSLGAGATLVILAGQKDVKTIIRNLETKGITIWNSVPAIMDMVVDNMDRYTAVRAGTAEAGEAAVPLMDVQLERPQAADEPPLLFWSPVYNWNIRNDRLRIGKFSYGDPMVEMFPQLYFLTQDGIPREALLQSFPNLDARRLESFIDDLVGKRVLVGSILPPGEAFAPQRRLFKNTYNEAVLYDENVYNAFKKHQQTRTFDRAHPDKVALADTPEFPAFISQRRSYRSFEEGQKIPFNLFSRLMSIFKHAFKDDKWCWYYYASAGGLYPIDLFIHVKAGRVEGFDEGIYYYSPLDNSLSLVNRDPLIGDDAHYTGNKEIFDSSAATVYFIYNARANMPKYGESGYLFALVDTGIMVGTLTQAAELTGIGLCSIGTMNFDRIREQFRLQDYQVWVHAVELGIKPGTVPAEVEPVNGAAVPVPAHAKTPSSGNERALRLVMLSGDWIPLGLPGRITRYFPGARTISLGGATEGSIWSIYYPIEEVDKDWKSIPYGYPLANQQFYVLDFRGRFCPLDVPGELHIGGKGVAEGYMAEEEKTRYSFIHHESMGRLYRTGDMGVFRKQGYIEFLGRRDSQVKIRGYRIELGEIENQLMEHQDVTDVIVMVRSEGREERYLCAYIITDASVPGTSAVTSAQLREHLARRLPDYMIPSYFINIDRKNLPLTANGKVNRKALPVPGGAQEVVPAETSYAPPETEMEHLLVSICAEVADDEKVGIYDNLFDLGIDSIGIAEVNKRIKKDLQVHVPLVKLFEHSNLHTLAEYLEELKETGGKSPASAASPVKAQQQQQQQEEEQEKTGVMDRGKQRRKQRRKKQAGS